MTLDQRTERLFAFLKWFVVVFIVLGISSKFEHSLAVSVGCKISPAFAQTIADGELAAKVQMEKDPETMRQLGRQMTIAKYKVRGITSFLLAFVIVYFTWIASSQKINPTSQSSPLN